VEPEGTLHKPLCKASKEWLVAPWLPLLVFYLIVCKHDDRQATSHNGPIMRRAAASVVPEGGTTVAPGPTKRKPKRVGRGIK